MASVTLSDLKRYQKRMRLAPTKPEAAFRQRLLDAGIHFEFQAIVAPYIADFAFPTKMLIIELDGQHHKESEQLQYDLRRDAYLRRRGFTILRIDNDDAPDFVLAVVADYASVKISFYAKVLREAAARYGTVPAPKVGLMTRQEKRERRLARLRPCPVCKRMLTPSRIGNTIRHKHKKRWCVGGGMKVK